jgi:hypothetical protein
MNKQIQNLINAYEEYLINLHAELSETATLATLHGWNSNRIEIGKKFREKIARLKKQIEKEAKR